MRLFTFGELRKVTLPPERPDEDDALRALRMNCNSRFRDSAKVAVPTSVERLVLELQATEPPPPAEED